MTQAEVGSAERGILIALPALDEAPNLPDVLGELRHAWPQAVLLVVDDGSDDATARVAREHGAQVVSLPFHLGYGAAVQTGIKFGLRHGFGVVVTFDADGQHDPADIAPLVDAVRGGADLAIGSRALAPESYQGGLAQALGPEPVRDPGPAAHRPRADRSDLGPEGARPARAGPLRAVPLSRPLSRRRCPRPRASSAARDRRAAGPDASLAQPAQHARWGARGGLRVQHAPFAGRGRDRSASPISGGEACPHVR